MGKDDDDDDLTGRMGMMLGNWSQWETMGKEKKRKEKKRIEKAVE